VDLGQTENAEDQSRKSRPAPEIDQHADVGVDVLNQLRTIEDVAPPYIGETSGAHQIDPLVPAEQQLDIGTNPVDRFTSNAELVTEGFWGQRIGHPASFH